jgi:hypothetical protein
MKIVNVVGGLGSQMMAYCFSLSLKKKYSTENVLCDFSAYYYFARRGHNGSELQSVFGIKEEKAPFIIRNILHSKLIFFRIIRRVLLKLKVLKWHDAISGKYNYDPSVYGRDGTVIYNQTWTSWKYFSELQTEIIKIFNFKEIDAKDEKNKYILSKIRSTNSVSIHVRLGDYLGNSVLGDLINYEYYKEGVSIIGNKVTNPVYYIFSDDSKKCKDYIDTSIMGEHYFIDWNKNDKSYIDMQLMSECKNHIIANSSFGWWGAYLGYHSNQIVIAPKIWSNEKTGVELKDMNLPNWMILENKIKKNGN